MYSRFCLHIEISFLVLYLGSQVQIQNVVIIRLMKYINIVFKTHRVTTVDYSMSNDQVLTFLLGNRVHFFRSLTPITGPDGFL